MRKVYYECTLLVTLLIAEILSGKNVRAWVSMDFTSDKYLAPRTIEKNENHGSPLGATS